MIAKERGTSNGVGAIRQIVTDTAVAIETRDNSAELRRRAASANLLGFEDSAQALPRIQPAVLQLIRTTNRNP